MSGTSMDGIDLALIESDGEGVIHRQEFLTIPYKNEFKNHLRSLIYGSPSLLQIKQVENELTLINADLINDFLKDKNIKANEIDVIGFHGHTILHTPEQQITWQIGNGHLLAHKTGINVVSDFRTHDIMLGGQGAPLVPIYHFHLFHDRPHPTAVLNIGGISNITYFDAKHENNIQAFDVCFGNAPLDDIMHEKFNLHFDEDGALAKSGKIDEAITKEILRHDIFHKKPPKSFDRDDFSEIIKSISALKTEDALATLTHIHARAVAINIDFFDQKPKELLICGGGRKNSAIIDEMKKCLPGIAVRSTEEININGDSIEAEAFAFLAIRKLRNLPISFTKTTGTKEDSCGGVFYKK